MRICFPFSKMPQLLLYILCKHMWLYCLQNAFRLILRTYLIKSFEFLIYKVLVFIFEKMQRFVCTCSGELCTEFPCGSGCSIRFSVLLSRLSSACDCSNTLSELLLRDWGWSSSPVDRGPRSFRSDIRLQSMLFACSFRVAYSCRACSDLKKKGTNYLSYIFFNNADIIFTIFRKNNFLSDFSFSFISYKPKEKLLLTLKTYMLFAIIYCFSVKKTQTPDCWCIVTKSPGFWIPLFV